MDCCGSYKLRQQIVFMRSKIVHRGNEMSKRILLVFLFCVIILCGCYPLGQSKSSFEEREIETESIETTTEQEHITECMETMEPITIIEDIEEIDEPEKMTDMNREPQESQQPQETEALEETQPAMQPESKPIQTENTVITSPPQENVTDRDD